MIDFNKIEELLNLVKQAYFQGGGEENEPSQKKRKYKPEKAIRVQPRFKEVFYKNFDLYETEGTDGPAKHGPGAGFYQNMSKYKSVSDFIKQKRKRNKNKYKSDDSYISDKKAELISRIERIAQRREVLELLTKTALDFEIDEIIQSDPILGDSGSSVHDSIYFGGQTDQYLQSEDFEGKDPSKLNYGRDYIEDLEERNKVLSKTEELEDLLKNLSGVILQPKEPELFGLPQGIKSQEDLDAPSDEDVEYGTTDSGNDFYNKMWI